MSTWYVAVQGNQQGPMTEADLVGLIRSGQVGQEAHIFRQGMDGWAPLTSHPPFATAASGGQPGTPPPVPAAQTAAAYGQHADEIDYQIHGEEMQFVTITLDPGEACVAEAGAFMFMDPGIEMNTIFGDGSGQEGGGGFMGKLLTAGKRVLTGESLFMTIFGNQAGQRQDVAFASPYPGRIVPLDLRQHNGTILCQKDAFLCAAKGVAVDIAFQRKIRVGFFGGEGFILQKLQGDGLAFVHAGGTIVERELAPGETLRLDTGCLVALEAQVEYDIQFVGGVKTAFFGGEGLVFATLTGPGKVWIQSLPFSRLASRVFAAAPQTGGRRKGEGSILDHVGGLGNLLDGD